MLGALRHRNYRLFLIGQIVSTIGTWMQTVALPWLALELTHNGFLVGLVLAAQFLPVLLLSPFAGEIADRYRKRTVLLITQSSFVLPPLALFALTATGQSQYWEIILAALATGAINAPDVPGRDGRQARPAERHRAELFRLQRLGRDRPVDRRHPHRAGRRPHLLPDQLGQLPGGDRGAPAHAKSPRRDPASR